MTMLWRVAARVLATGLVGASSRAAPPVPVAPQVAGICASATVADAVAQGERLGWRRMTEAEFASWRKTYTAAFGPVDVVGWRRGADEKDGSISFWVGRDTTGERRACFYQIDPPGGLLDGLIAELGAPDALERQGETPSATWDWRDMAVTYVQIGTLAAVSFATK